MFRTTTLAAAVTAALCLTPTAHAAALEMQVGEVDAPIPDAPMLAQGGGGGGGGPARSSQGPGKAVGGPAADLPGRGPSGSAGVPGPGGSKRRGAGVTGDRDDWDRYNWERGDWDRFPGGVPGSGPGYRGPAWGPGRGAGYPGAGPGPSGPSRGPGYPGYGR